MSDDRKKEYRRQWRDAHKETLRAQARQRYARLTAKPKRPKPKTYAEIAAFNRANPIQEGWRR